MPGCRARSWRICGVGPARSPGDERRPIRVSRKLAAMTSGSDREIQASYRAAFLLTAEEVVGAPVVDVRGYVLDMAGAKVRPREPVGVGPGALGPVRWLDRRRRPSP